MGVGASSCSSSICIELKLDSLVFLVCADGMSKTRHRSFDRGYEKGPACSQPCTNQEEFRGVLELTNSGRAQLLQVIDKSRM